MPTKPKIQGQTFLFTGTLTEFTRDEVEALVEANGGKVLSGVSAKLNYLVVGEDAGSKLAKAKALGTVIILTEKEFLKMVPKDGQRSIDQSKVSREKQSSGVVDFPDILLGNETWMQRNLEIAQFRNGDVIPILKTEKEWIQAAKKKQPACCYYENKVKNRSAYGLLYNWFAVSDPRGLAPNGWKIPTEEEWTEMERSLGKEPGQKIKNPNGWDLDGNGLKKSLLLALPSGMRQEEGLFFGAGWSASWWCSGSHWFPDQLWIRSVESEDTEVTRSMAFEGEGHAVRCIRQR